MRTLGILVSTSMSMSLLAACGDGSSCDPDQRYDHGICYSLDAPAGEDDVSDASSEAFGTACADDAGCASPTTYCAKQPGQTMGYCTRTGCIEDPTVCPSSWTCLDLSVFEAGLPSMCKRP